MVCSWIVKKRQMWNVDWGMWCGECGFCVNPGIDSFPHFTKRTPHSPHCLPSKFQDLFRSFTPKNVYFLNDLHRSLKSQVALFQLFAHQAGCYPRKFFKIFEKMHLIEIAAVVTDVRPCEMLISFEHFIGL